MQVPQVHLCPMSFYKKPRPLSLGVNTVQTNYSHHELYHESIYLYKSNLCRVFSETLSACVEAVLPDQSVPVAADSTVQGNRTHELNH